MIENDQFTIQDEVYCSDKMFFAEIIDTSYSGLGLDIVGTYKVTLVILASTTIVTSKELTLIIT